MMKEVVSHKLKLQPVPPALPDRIVIGKCGECLITQLLSIFEVIENFPGPSQEQIIEALDRVYCRCASESPAKASVARAAILRALAKTRLDSQR